MIQRPSLKRTNNPFEADVEFLAQRFEEDMAGMVAQIQDATPLGKAKLSREEQADLYREMQADPAFRNIMVQRYGDRLVLEFEQMAVRLAKP